MEGEIYIESSASVLPKDPKKNSAKAAKAEPAKETPKPPAHSNPAALIVRGEQVDRHFNFNFDGDLIGLKALGDKEKAQAEIKELLADVGEHLRISRKVNRVNGGIEALEKELGKRLKLLK